MIKAERTLSAAESDVLNHGLFSAMDKMRQWTILKTEKCLNQLENTKTVERENWRQEA